MILLIWNRINTQIHKKLTDFTLTLAIMKGEIAITRTSIICTYSERSFFGTLNIILASVADRNFFYLKIK